MSKGKKPLVIGHRGNSGNAPANTIEAIRQAIDIGVDMIEIDVRLTKDRVPILIHNDTVDETTDGKGLVSEMSFDQIRKLDAGSWKDKKYKGEKIPTLMEVLDYTKGKVYLSIDLKEESAIPEIVKAIHDADMVDGVVICGCAEPQAKAIWQLNENLSVLLNTDSELDRLAKMDDKTEFIKEYIRRACKERFSVLNVSYKFVTDELIYKAHLRGLSVWTWTVDKEEDIKQLIEMGVDGIYSNYPERVIKVLTM
ncbi:MAG: glycerophosphodiester phosphodiesterase [Candidatus Poribacteria bacterium]